MVATKLNLAVILLGENDLFAVFLFFVFFFSTELPDEQWRDLETTLDE